MATYFTSLSDPGVIELINNGAIGVIPTDTVYGLVGRAKSEQAIKRLYAVKSRERQPGTTVAASVEDLQSIGFPKKSLAVAEHFWPDAMSVEMGAAGIPLYLSTGQQVMAARIPNNASLLKVLSATGPLMTTSANAPKQPTSVTVQMAVDYFGDEVDFYVDGGDLSGRPPSTIIGFDENNNIVVYRHGAVTVSQ